MTITQAAIRKARGAPRSPDPPRRERWRGPPLSADREVEVSRASGVVARVGEAKRGDVAARNRAEVPAAVGEPGVVVADVGVPLLPAGEPAAWGPVPSRRQAVVLGVDGRALVDSEAQ